MNSKFLLITLFLLLSALSLIQAQTAIDSIGQNAILERALRIRLNNPDSAIYYSKQVINSVKPSSTYLKGFAYYVLSYSNWVKANYKLSAEYGFRSLKYMETLDAFHYEKSLVMLSLCRTFLDLDNNIEGKKYLERVLVLANMPKADPRILANYYRELSFYFAETNQEDSALNAADKGIVLYEQLNDILNKSVLYSRKARIYLVQLKFEEALRLCRTTLVLDSLVKNKRAFGIGNLQIAMAFAGLRKYDSSIYFLKKSISVNKEINNWQSLYKAHQKLSEVHLARQNPLMAVEELKLAEIYKDSLYNVRSSGQVEEMKILYETEKKDNTIALLEKENALKLQQARNQRLFVGMLLLLIVFLWVVLFTLLRSQRLQKRTNEELEIKNRSIEQQKEEMQVQAEKLQDLNQLKSKLFSVISHDLRGPINNLRSLLDLFTKNLLTQQEFIEHSDKLRASVNITQRTLENLLNWSLSQMEGIRTRPSILDLKSSVDEAAKLLNDIGLRKNISIRNGITEATLVYVDPDQLQLILRNLIHNSIKFSEMDSDVFITAFTNEEFCSVSVKDSGIGISKEEMSRLAIAKEHFTKIGTLQEKGTGLGLLLCKEFVKRNGGTLSINSEAGVGTEIIFTVPMA